MPGRLSATGPGLRNNVAANIGPPRARNTGGVFRKDVYFGGNDYVAGVVTINNIPRLAKVRLHDQRSGLVVAGGWTDAEGAFRFDNLSPLIPLYITAFDPITGEQAAIFDRI